MSENSKFIAMRNIDPGYTTRIINDQYYFMGVEIDIRFEKYEGADQRSFIMFKKEELEIMEDHVGSLNGSAIRSVVRELCEKFKNEGGTLNE